MRMGFVYARVTLVIIYQAEYGSVKVLARNRIVPRDVRNK